MTWDEIKPTNRFRAKPGGPKSGVMDISMYKQTCPGIVHCHWDKDINLGGPGANVLREIANLAIPGLSVKVTKRR